MLIERDEIIDNVRDRLDRVAESGGQIVLISGEAGIGKSSVIDAFLSRLPPSLPRAVGLCDPLHTPRPLGPVRDIFQSMFGTGLNDLEEARFFEGFVWRAGTLRDPIVLVIEDLHWADQRSLDWLNYLGRRISQLPILLIGSFRDDEVEATHALRTALGGIPASRKLQCRLAPLSLSAIRQIASGSGYSAERLNTITGGNPFFITEVLNHKQDAGVVPISVSDAVNARINALPEATRNLLELASCCPGGISLELLQDLTGGTAVTLLPNATERQLLIASGRHFKFRHELARLVTYERLSPPARTDAHARIMSALLAQDAAPPLDMIVHHARGADSPNVVLEFAPRAANIAAKLGAHREAAMHLDAALHYVDQAPPEDAAVIHECWAHEAGLARRIDDAVIGARKKAVALWQQIDRPERVGENLRWLSRMHWYRGESEMAQHYLEDAITVLENGLPSSAKARAYALRAQFFMLQDNMDEALQWARKALEIADQVGDEETRAHALNTAGSAALFRGDTQGEADLRESLEIARQHGFHIEAARVYTNLSECLIEMGALQKAEALIEEGITFDSEHDLDAWTFYLVGRKAQLRFEQDRYAEAITIAQGVLTQDDQTLLMRMPAMIVLARSKLRLNENGVRDDLDTALAGAQKIGEPQYLVPLHIAQIEAAVLAGDPALAASHIAWIEQLNRGLLSPRKHGEFLFWATLAGHDVTAHDTSNLPQGFAAVASGAFDRAYEYFDNCGAAYLAAWSLVAKGGSDAVLRADEILQTIDALPARKALRARLPNLTDPAALSVLKRGKYRDARRHPYGLTRKEQIVLQFLANGASNDAIAKDLSRSRRTVENHVSAILSKMRAKNRMEVVLRTQSEPWILSEDQPHN
nr:AAA family ATPase [uncultured Roseovarius sp.]